MSLLLLKFSLFTDYPWYFVLFCLLLGLGYAYFTYQRNTISEGKSSFAWPVWLLFLLRFLSTSLLAFLLLSPVVKSIFKKVEKPVIVLAVDNSQSILLNKDSSYYKNGLQKDVNKLAEELGKDYDVRTFSFGTEVKEDLKFDYTEKQTSLSGLYDKIYNTFYNQNIGAVITLTDGIYNQGQNPLYSVEKFNAPFYMVALGDTVPQKDVLIRDVQYNQVVYSGNVFPLNIMFRAKKYRGQEVRLSVSHKGKSLFTQAVNIANDNFYQEVPARIQADEAGMQHYRIEVSRLDGEVSYVNNSYDVFIDVLDSKRKILIVGQSPHPDIAAMKNSIERNAFYEASAYTYADFNKEIGANVNKLKNYQLAILHQLPGINENGLPLINALKEDNVPILYVTGSQSAYNIFNTQDAGLSIQPSAGKMNDVTAYVNNQFGLFTLSDDVALNIGKWPPLQSAFGSFQLTDRQGVLLWQQIGRVKTDMPLLLFSRSGSRKNGVLAGEGIWRWFLADYSLNQNFKVSDELLNKAVQYLSVKSDSRLFRVRPTKNLFYEDEKISFEAEAYNESYEPLPNANIGMKIKNSAGKVFDFTFQPRGSAYFLDAGYLPAGEYTYQSSVKIGGKTYALHGEFMVKKVELEYLETVADHQLLNAMAARQGGSLLYPKDMGSLPELLEKRDDIQSVAYMQTEFKDLIHFKALFFILLLLLGGEWLLRKYFGSY